MCSLLVDRSIDRSKRERRLSLAVPLPAAAPVVHVVHLEPRDKAEDLLHFAPFRSIFALVRRPSTSVGARFGIEDLVPGGWRGRGIVREGPRALLAPRIMVKACLGALKCPALAPFFIKKSKISS